LSGREGEEGCKHRGRLAAEILVLLRGYWLYFSKDGTLNSDGRRLAARIARAASASGCREVARLLYEAIRYGDALEKIAEAAEAAGAEEDPWEVAELALYGPWGWRVREHRLKPRRGPGQGIQ